MGQPIRGDIAVRRLHEVYAHCNALPDEWWWKHEARNLDDWLAVVLEEYERAQA